MKKLISLLCIIAMVISNLSGVVAYSAPVYDTNSNSVSYDFEGYTGTADYSVSALNSYGGSWSTYYFSSGITGVTSAQTDKGTSINIVNKAAADEYPYTLLEMNMPGYISTSLHLKFSIKNSDTYRPRIIRLDNSSSLYVALFNGSALTLFGGNATTMGSVADKWYDIDLKLNFKTGYYQVNVTCDGVTESFEGVNAAAISYKSISYVQMGYYGNGKNGVVNNTYMDNISLSTTEPLYKSFVSENNFDSFDGSLDGTTIPEGFTGSGVSQNENGFYSENDKLKIKTSNNETLILKKTISIPSNLSIDVFGNVCSLLDYNLSDTNANRTFMIGGQEILSFCEDGRIVAGASSSGYEINKEYKIIIRINPKSKTVTVIVKDGTTELIEEEISLTSEMLSDISLKTVQVGPNPSVAYIGSFNLYNDNGLSLVSTNPSSGSKGLIPCDVFATFNNPIESVGYVTLNGQPVEYDIISKMQVYAYSENVMEYNSDYTIKFGEVTDVFGESKDYTITFTTIAAKVLSDISIENNTNVTAKVSGLANDGKDYSYTLILAQFNSDNMLMNIASKDFSLKSELKEYTASLAYTSETYYEAYLWDSVENMIAVCNKSTFGTEPFSSVTPRGTKFYEDMDSGVVTCSNLGISTSGTSTLIVFKPGKTPSDISSSGELMGVIDYIKQFDKASNDAFAFTPSNGNGYYTYSLDGEYSSDGFNYIDPQYVVSVYDEINSDGASFIECINLYNDILGCDTTELFGFNTDEKDNVEQIMLLEREARSDGFDTISSFQNAFYKAVAQTLIEFSTSSVDVKTALEKYGIAYGADKFTTYKTYSESNDTAKAEIYAAISAKSKEEKDSFKEVDIIFTNATIPSAVRNSQNQTQIANILNDNNDNILHFDFSKYNKLTNKSALHTMLIGTYVVGVEDFKRSFDEAVEKRLIQEANEKDVSEGVVVSGNHIAFDFEGYVGNNDSLSIKTLASLSSNWWSYGLGEGYAGPTSVKTDRGISVNLVNRGGEEDYSNAALRLDAKSAIATTADIKFSIQFKELNRPATAYMSGGGKQINLFFVNGGSMSLLGNTLTMSAQTDKWYDIAVRVNKVSGYYEASITCGDNKESFSGLRTDISELSAIEYIGMGYVGNRVSGTESNMWYDDILISESEPLYLSYVSEYDFKDFNEGYGGTSIPDGFKATGIINGANGFFKKDDSLVVKTSQAGNITLTKDYLFSGTFNSNAYGTIKTDINIQFSDYSANRTLMIGDYEIISFTSDGSVIVGEARSSYGINKDYKLTVKADTKKLTDDKGQTYYNLVTVLLSDETGVVFNATKKIPLDNIKSTTLNVSHCNASSETIVDSFNVYSDNGFYISSSNPGSYDKGIIPCDALIMFSNKIVDVKSVTLNDTPVAYEISDNNSLKIKTKSHLDYNSKYTLKLSGVQDIFGEKKDFKLIFYTGFASNLTDISIKDGDNVTASVTGYSYDGNKYNYVLLIAKFDGSSNKLLDIKKTNISLSSAKKEYTVSVPKTENAYYEAYVWDSVKGMSPIKSKACLGNKALTDIISDEDGYIQNMDTSVITATNTGVSGDGSNTLLIYKPGKSPSDLSGASSLLDVIDYMGQFDNCKIDTYSFTPRNSGGSYGVAINGVYKPNAFMYVDSSVIESALSQINSDGVSFVDAVDTFNNVFKLNTEELNEFDTAQTDRLEQLILEEREKLDNGFESIDEFCRSYNYAVSRVVVENAENGADIKTAFEKYGSGLGIENFAAYGSYKKLSQDAKNKVYDDIAAINDLSTVEKIENAFADASILRAVQHAENYVEINNIINDNNSYLKFDVSNYNSLSKQSAVNKALIGKYYSSIEQFEAEFIKAVYTQKTLESTSSGKPTGVGGSAGNMVTLGQVVPSVDSSVFNDISDYGWAKQAIESLAQKGIISGRTNGIFDPGANITREEFVKIVVNALIGADNMAQCTFSDVDSNAWYYVYVATAQKYGIINGVNLSEFGIGENITRQDMATILYRASKQIGIYLDDGTMIFDDSEFISDYAQDAVKSLHASGIINGKGNNCFGGRDYATRAETAKMVYKLMERGDN